MAHVGIIMGSTSDLSVMQQAADVLEELGVTYEITVVSAHRTPERMFSYAHLPGMTASITPLPVIGVPIKSRNSIDGWDSVLSILQMPAGVPVATVALDGATNAGILAAQIIGASDPALLTRIVAYKEALKLKVMKSVADLGSKP
jgi:5-(carboxyamino)imidazole ribonucleotide mutase